MIKVKVAKKISCINLERETEDSSSDSSSESSSSETNWLLTNFSILSALDMFAIFFSF